MMDNALIQLIARLKIRLRQEKGFSINTQKFFSDTGYASQVLDMAEDSEEVDLVSLSLDIREKLGWISSPQFSSAIPTAVVQADEEKRYVFGARS
ncbi:MAG: hypothetical protein JWM03_1673 [Rhodocyclales bacterium]|nr:hypothetical protein [Rhodocyclales bacterium]MDB5888801.1 hypothetical protein [Rhodocyclales bacterium]